MKGYIVTVGMAGRAMTAGEHGKKLHLLQPTVTGRGYVPMCRVNSYDVDAQPLEGRGLRDVTCKTCRRVLAALARRRLRYG